MDSSEKPHRATSNSELFICFTSRLSSSSSSMKLSSKSILSPGRAREPSQISLSSSLSRRLRSNGSMKGGQASPMFPTGGKKRGNFENPEPSSPKVTCIGQVRVKTKKQGKKMRSRSRKRGEVSFRKVEQSNSNVEPPNLGNLGNFHSDLSHRQQPEGLPHRNQRWVHLPLTICEALRAFGTDFNCFLPCRSSCSSRDHREDHKEEGAGNGGSSTSSCGAVFARWLVAAQEGEAAAEESILERRSSQRRDVFEGIEFEEEKCERKNEVVEEEEEEARVSICVPPKNALLLMRCRSDPLRMAALANRFWESPAPQDEDGEYNKDGEDEENGKEEEDDVEEGEVARKSEVGTKRHKVEEICEKWVAVEEALEKHEIPEAEENGEESEEDDDSEIRELQDGNSENQEEEKELEVSQSLSEEKETVFPSENEENLDQLLEENEDLPMLLHEQLHEHNEGGENEEEHHKEERSTGIHTFPVPEEEEPEAEAEESSMEEKETSEDEVEPEPENPDTKERPGLPDCLLLMMCEPKLSMEVSKETWVCSTDFIRWHPEKHVEKVRVKKTDGGDAPKKRISIDSNPAAALPPPPPPQPARSSCSFPSATAAASSMATMIEQKLVNAVAYEPFVLTRCKSEPMRTAAKLAPEACFWKSRKLEPHKPAVGAAGVGF